MKLLSCAMVVGLFLAGTAQAEVKTEIKELSSLNYDGDTLGVVYRLGGGCQDHTAVFEVTLQQGKDKQVTATVKVFDTSPDFDGCEAYIAVGGDVNLKKVIADKLQNAGLEAWQVSVQLPNIAVTPQER